MRRHSGKSQRAAIAVELERHFAKEAEIRMKNGNLYRDDPPELIPEGLKGDAREHAAVALNTSA